MILYMYVNSTVAGKYNQHKQDGSHLGFPVRMILATVDLQVTSILPMNLSQLPFQFRRKSSKQDFEDGHHSLNLGFPITMI